MLTGMSSSRFTGLLAAGLAIGLAAASLSGCAGGPPQVDPAGVDGLEIPTPSPDPRDFVASVDNPWLPLEPGTVWTYRARSDVGTETITVTVTGTYDCQFLSIIGITTLRVTETGTATVKSVLGGTEQ